MRSRPCQKLVLNTVHKFLTLKKVLFRKISGKNIKFWFDFLKLKTFAKFCDLLIEIEYAIKHVKLTTYATNLHNYCPCK